MPRGRPVVGFSCSELLKNPAASSDSRRDAYAHTCPGALTASLTMALVSVIFYAALAGRD